MIIYNSMIMWIVILGIWNNLMIRSKQRRYGSLARKGSYEVPMYLAILTFAYIIFWVGMRSGVADTGTYIMGFNSCSTSLSDIPQYWNLQKKRVQDLLLLILFLNILYRQIIMCG